MPGVMEDAMASQAANGCSVKYTVWEASRMQHQHPHADLEIIQETSGMSD